MIAFGTAVTDAVTYDRFAAPGIRLAAETDSEILAHQSTGSLFRNYNLLLDMAREHEDLEALVLLHQDSEIIDPDFCRKVREALSEPGVELVGCAGAIGVRSIAWWEGAVTWASFIHRYPEFGGGDFPSLTVYKAEIPSYARTGEVDAIDGFIMVLSPWAVRELRFDESLGRLHGYDFDFCCQVRASGRKVATADFRAIHHHSLELISDPGAWIDAYMRLTEKWAGKLPHVGGGADDWRMRALRAEAEAAYAKGDALASQLQAKASRRQLERLEASSSWRLTKPLRALRQRLRPNENGVGD